MPTPLRAFLMMFLPDTTSSVSVFHDLESVVKAWEARDNRTSAAGVLHIGFERMPSHTYKDVATKFPGQMLVTASTKFALPNGFCSSSAEVGQVEGHSLYLGIQGWGYEAADIAAVEAKPQTHTFDGWLLRFVRENPEAEKALAVAGIRGETDYEDLEALLEPNLRMLLGLFRFEELIRNGRGDPCEFARAAPPWVRAMDFRRMEMTVRVANVFKAVGISKVSDLDGYTAQELTRFKNFGRTSINDLVATLHLALTSGPPQHFEEAGAGTDPLITLLQRSLSRLSERAKDVLIQRMGLDCAPRTLAEIGEIYGITRERIRQIEAKTIGQFKKETWPETCVRKITAVLSSRDYSIPLVGVEAIDSWFAGMADKKTALTYLLENVCECPFYVVKIDGLEIIGALEQSSWEKAVGDSCAILATAAEQAWTLSRCKSIVAALLPQNAHSFDDILWEKASALCHFGADDAGETVLQAYGRSVEAIVQAVLQEADTPIHFTEIAERASARAHRQIDVRRAHKAAAVVGILLGRGEYGLARHLPLEAPEMRKLGEEAVDLILDGLPGRQWHSEEILLGLHERQSTLPEAVDKYVIDAAIRMSGLMESLGRLVWTQTSDQTQNYRIEVRQAVEALVKQAGHPLKGAEIRQRLTEIRGTSVHLQILPSGTLIRVGPGLWGINDRDVPIKFAEQAGFCERVVMKLREFGKGIHSSEFRDSLPVPLRMTPESVMSVASLDPRLSCGSGYLFLDEWGDPKRTTASEAVIEITSTTSGRHSFSKILGLVDQKVGLRCDPKVVASCLQASGVTLDRSGELLFGFVRPNQDDEDDLATVAA